MSPSQYTEVLLQILVHWLAHKSQQPLAFVGLSAAPTHKMPTQPWLQRYNSWAAKAGLEKLKSRSSKSLQSVQPVVEVNGSLLTLSVWRIGIANVC